ncbi:MAG: ThiF family adenylyltransferase, partial [Peptostreptococcaceae bacterium]|nr:ThiF family adenylyltransferase [Peptostreptococcaceae bacterium]
MERFKRTESLIGKEKLDLLKNATVFIFGVGGVGGFAAESLARAGIENIGLVDYDKIHISNINRQIHALDETVGESKVSVMKK